MPSSEPNPSRLSTPSGEESIFSEIVQLIADSQEKAIRAVNTVLIELYWRVGESSVGRLPPRNGAMASCGNSRNISRGRNPDSVDSRGPVTPKTLLLKLSSI